MEEDPMIPQRMRDIARMQLCTEVVESLNKCGKDHVMYILNYSEMQCVDCWLEFISYFQGFKYFMMCRKEKDDLLECIKNWMDNNSFRERVTIEYLNERSHFRETGVKTKRYEHGGMRPRNEDIDGPSLDKNGHYRPQKPTVSFWIGTDDVKIYHEIFLIHRTGTNSTKMAPHNGQITITTCNRDLNMQLTH